jgi:hypothetical protein
MNTPERPSLVGPAVVSDGAEVYDDPGTLREALKLPESAVDIRALALSGLETVIQFTQDHRKSIFAGSATAGFILGGLRAAHR